MEVGLIEHLLKMESRLQLHKDAVDERNFAHQLISREDHFNIFGLSRVDQRISESLLQPLTLRIGIARSDEIGSHDQEQAKQEY